MGADIILHTFPNTRGGKGMGLGGGQVASKLGSWGVYEARWPCGQCHITWRCLRNGMLARYRFWVFTFLGLTLLPPADSQGWLSTHHPRHPTHPDLPPPDGAAPVSVCLHHFLGGRGRLGGLRPCRLFHSVIINLIDLDFNSFILEQLAKTLLTQKVYARLVYLFLEYSSIQT